MVQVAKHQRGARGARLRYHVLLGQHDRGAAVREQPRQRGAQVPEQLRLSPPPRDIGVPVLVRGGGKVDDRHGAPVTVTGRVAALSDGQFVHKGPMLRGLPGRLGPTALLQVGGVKIILISHRWQTLDLEMIRIVGIEPTT